jgi:hypothetical protein
VEHSSTGPAEFQYLHTILTVRHPTKTNTSFFHIHPLLHNEAFAMGHEGYPRVAKLEIFLGYSSARYADLRPFVFARLVTFETIFRTEDPRDRTVERDSKNCLQVLSLEILRLRWPIRWFANILVEFPFYRRSWFALLLRRVGRNIRKNHVLAVWCNDESAFFHEFEAGAVVLDLVAMAFRDVVETTLHDDSATTRGVQDTGVHVPIVRTTTSC